jgi:hypothetical protein
MDRNEIIFQANSADKITSIYDIRLKWQIISIQFYSLSKTENVKSTAKKNNKEKSLKKRLLVYGRSCFFYKIHIQ